jgi:hypothetical protein
MLGVEGIPDDYFTGSIRSALLEMVSVGDSLIIMAAPTGFSGAVGGLTFGGKRVSVASLKKDPLVRGVLRYDHSRMKKKDEQCD